MKSALFIAKHTFRGEEIAVDDDVLITAWLVEGLYNVFKGEFSPKATNKCVYPLFVMTGFLLFSVLCGLRKIQCHSHFLSCPPLVLLIAPVLFVFGPLGSLLYERIRPLFCSVPLQTNEETLEYARATVLHSRLNCTLVIREGNLLVFGSIFSIRENKAGRVFCPCQRKQRRYLGIICGHALGHKRCFVMEINNYVGVIGAQARC